MLEFLHAVVFVLLLLLQLIKPANEEEALTPPPFNQKVRSLQIFSTEKWTTDLAEEIYLIGNHILLYSNKKPVSHSNLFYPETCTYYVEKCYNF